jgi:Protein of unknown function (DUF2550)
MGEEVAYPLALVVTVALVLLGAVVAVTVRRRLLAGSLGAFDCSARPAGRSWALGVARYGPDRLEWFRVFSLSPRPRSSWGRSGLVLLGRRNPEPAERAVLLPAAVVVRCTYEGDPLLLAMSEDAYTGLSSWIEAAPPGQLGLVN